MNAWRGSLCAAHGPRIHTQNELTGAHNTVTGAVKEGREVSLRASVEKDLTIRRYDADRRELQGRLAAAEAAVKQ